MPLNLQRKIVVISSDSKSLKNFRFDMMLEFQRCGLRVMAYAPHDAYFERAKKILGAQDITLLGLPIKNTGLNPFYDLKSFLKLYQAFKIQKPDYVFAYTAKPVIYGSLAARLAGVKMVASMMSGLGHIYTTDDFKTKILRTLANFLYRLAFLSNHVVIFQNPDDRQVFLDLRLLTPAKAALTAGSGVNLEQFPFTPLPATDRLKFLFIGRLLKSKGIEEFCRAAASLKVIYPEAEFQVLGGMHSNPSQLDLPQLKLMMNTSGIQYLGERDSTLDALQQSHVVVLPSYREGTPKALLEALSVGRPIITTQVPGCRETVISGKNGVLIPVRDSSALAKAMEALIQNPQQLSSMGKASRHLAEEKFDVNKVNRHILEILGFLPVELP